MIDILDHPFTRMLESPIFVEVFNKHNFFYSYFSPSHKVAKLIVFIFFFPATSQLKALKAQLKNRDKYLQTLIKQFTK